MKRSSFIVIFIAIILSLVFAFSACAVSDWRQSDDKHETPAPVTVTDDATVGRAVRAVLLGLSEELEEGTIDYDISSKYTEGESHTSYFAENTHGEVKRDGDNFYAHSTRAYDSASSEDRLDLSQPEIAYTYNGSYIHAVAEDGDTKIYGFADKEPYVSRPEGALALVFDGTINKILDDNGVDIHSDFTVPELIDKIKNMPLSDMYTLVKGVYVDTMNAIYYRGRQPDVDYGNDIPEFLGKISELFGDLTYNDMLDIFDEMSGDYGFTGERGLIFNFTDYLLDGFFGFSVETAGNTQTLIVTADAGDKLSGYIKRFADVFNPVTYNFNDAIKALFGVDLQVAYSELKDSFAPEHTLADAMDLILGYIEKYGATENDVLQMYDFVCNESGVSVPVGYDDYIGYYEANKNRTLRETLPEIFGCDSYEELLTSLDEEFARLTESYHSSLELVRLEGIPIFGSFDLDLTFKFVITDGKFTGMTAECTGSSAFDRFDRVYSSDYSTLIGYRHVCSGTYDLDFDLQMTVNSGIPTEVPQYVLVSYSEYVDSVDVRNAYKYNMPLYLELPFAIKGDMDISVQSAEIDIIEDYDYSGKKTVNLGNNLKVEGDNLVLTGMRDIIGDISKDYISIQIQGNVQLAVRVGDKVLNVPIYYY